MPVFIPTANNPFPPPAPPQREPMFDVKGAIQQARGAKTDGGTVVTEEEVKEILRTALSLNGDLKSAARALYHDVSDWGPGPVRPGQDNTVFEDKAADFIQDLAEVLGLTFEPRPL